MLFVYALFNRVNGKIYIGQTTNIEKRVAEHNQKKGNHFTAKVDGERILIYKEGVSDIKIALIREKQLKSYRGRQFIKEHIPK